MGGGEWSPAPAPSADWQTTARLKRESVCNLIPPAWRLPIPKPSRDDRKSFTGDYMHQFLNDREVLITETDAASIVKNTANGTWTALEVTSAFCHRAAMAHGLTSCLHEIFFDAALDDARRLDAYLAKHGRPIGPLHGLPVSLKDQFHVRGVETTMGYVGWVGTFEGVRGTHRERVFESTTVKELRALGAVLFCKTAVPQTIAMSETYNNIVGYVWNPHNRLLTCGGSSGGECTLLALKGSPLGIGTDKGGSLRIPATHCGVFSIRPSVGRLSARGIATSTVGDRTVSTVIGPMSGSAPALRLMFKSLLGSKPWEQDPNVVHMPWREDIEQTTQDCGIVVMPPVRRAMERVVEVLRKQGHKVILWETLDHDLGVQINEETVEFDGGIRKTHDLALSGEPRLRPKHVKTLDDDAVQYTGTQVAATNCKQRHWQEAYSDRWTASAERTGTGRPIDALIAPVTPIPPTPPLGTEHLDWYVLPSTLDYSAAVIPVTKVDAEVDKVDGSFRPISKHDETLWREYNPALTHGAPIGISIIGRRFEEEKVLVIVEGLALALQKAEAEEQC